MESDSFKLISKDKQFIIPSNFRFLTDVNPSIYSSLIESHEYKIFSNVNENVLQDFINNWVNNENININFNNFSQFQSLSQEFDRIKDLIEIFQQKTKKISYYNLRNKNLKQKVIERSKILTNESSNYEKIIEIFIKKERLIFQSTFSDRKKELIEACEKGNINYVNLQTSKKIEKNGYVYIFNETDKTVGLFSDKKLRSNVYVPRSIFYENEEYIITSILEGSFQNSQSIETIEFSDDSELKIIGRYAFSNSTLSKISIPNHVTKIEENAFSYCRSLQQVEFDENSEIKIIEKRAFAKSMISSLTIPSSVVDIHERCFFGTRSLTNINIIEKNEKNILYYDNSFIIGKSSPDQKNFDVLIVARRNIEKATIPSFIKYLNPDSFDQCVKFKKIDFSPNSELKSIGSFAFSSTSISEILIPSSVTIINSCAFSFCEKLKKIEFEENSKLSVIELHAFYNSSLEFLSIPSSVVELKDECFNSTNNLNTIKILKNENQNQNIIYYDDSYIIGKSSPEQDNFDVLIFARRDIENVIIPSFIKQINSDAFYYCSKIQKIEFAPNSELIMIGNYAFAYSSVKNIVIPSSVFQICASSFIFCESLEKVECLNDSNLISIGNNAFSYSSIKSISFPSSIKEIDEYCFIENKELIDINIIQRNEQNFVLYDDSFLIGKSSKYQKNFDFIITAKRNIKKAVIPSFIKKIAAHSFYQCTKLKEIEFQENSEINSIEYQTFAKTSIEKIKIPVKVKFIGQNAFTYCKKLQKIEFQENSELQKIEDYAFCNSSLKSISIPSSIVEIKEHSFMNTENMTNIKVIPNKIKNIDFYDDSFIIGKSLPNQKNFDVLIASRRDIKKAVIPSFIKKIQSHAFDHCQMLQKVEIPCNSQLVSLGAFAFAFTSFSSIFIPQNVVTIENNCFYMMKCNKIIEIDENSKLKSIRFVFYEYGNIIMIPSKLRNIEL